MKTRVMVTMVQHQGHQVQDPAQGPAPNHVPDLVQDLAHTPDQDLTHDQAQDLDHVHEAEAVLAGVVPDLVVGLIHRRDLRKGEDPDLDPLVHITTDTKGISYYLFSVLYCVIEKR